MTSLFRWNTCGSRNESFCFIYHCVIIEETCFSSHLKKKKKKGGGEKKALQRFSVSIVELRGSNVERDNSVRARQRGTS